MTEEYALDDTFSVEFDNLKKKRTINFILLKVEAKTIRIVKTGQVATVPKLAELLDDLHCSFVVYSLQGESEDGLIRTDRIFTVTFTPNMARPDEKLVYEMQKGKQLLKNTKGSIELHVSTKDELKRRINGVSFGVSKARKDDNSDDEDNAGSKDWMDD
jgi:hypothetical protein